MSYILYIALALLVPVLCVERPVRHKPQQWRLKPQVDLTSSVKIAKLISQLAKAETQHGIDMDYFGDSEERIEHNTRSVDRRSDTEDRFYSPKDRVRLIYVSNPEVLEEYKKKLKKIRVERGSYSASETAEEEGISYKDILQFLVQVDARLREREGRPTNKLPFLTPPKLNRILQNLRRQIENSEPRGRKRDTKETEYKGHTFPMRMDRSRESHSKVYESTEDIRKRKRESSEERGWNKKRSAENSWKKDSDIVTTSERVWLRQKKESSYESVKKPSWNHDRPRPRQKEGKVPNFFSTPIPMSGRQGIYEDDK